MTCSSGVSAYRVDANTLRGSLVGQSERTMDQLLHEISNLKGKSLLFFDEADSLLRRRCELNPTDIQLVDMFLDWADGLKRKQQQRTWKVLWGECTVDGACGSSPNFPGHYPDYSRCTSLQRAVGLHCICFSTARRAPQQDCLDRLENQIGRLSRTLLHLG